MVMDRIAADTSTGITTLVSILRQRVAEQGGQRAYTFLENGEREAEHLTYAQLDHKARAIAAQLHQQGFRGERLLLLYPPGLDFVAAFLGCLYAGAVAVPAYPPASRRHLPRLRAIALDARPSAALATHATLPKLRKAAGRLPELENVPWIATDTEDAPKDWAPPEIEPQALAFLQYTSGSTAAPKGVEITHANLIHNEALIQRGFDTSAASTIVGWLPLYHDMGLIGNVLHPLYLGAPCVLMAPVAFLQQPIRWLRAITHYRATTSGGPNFAYDLCVDKIDDEQKQTLDLSSWTTAFSGAEPVRAETLERFARAFASCGFQQRAFYPCYGMAEATLMITGGDPREEPTIAELDAAALEQNRVAPPTDPGATARRMVGCGISAADQILRIVDPETRCLRASGQVGEIWLAGPSVARGYWRQPLRTAEDFNALLEDDPLQTSFLRTGDLGFLRADGELFVTGRLKDMIIIRGRNHYPQDIEQTAEAAHPSLRPACGAAFAVEAEGEERLVVVHEIERHPTDDLDVIADALRRAVAAAHEIQVYDVVLIRTGSIHKTSSGKIQRHACRKAYLEDALRVMERSTVAADHGTEDVAAFTLDRDTLLASRSAERPALIAALLRDRFARLARLPVGRVDTTRPLTAHGLDSLTAVELKNEVDGLLDSDLDLEALLDGASIEDLAAQLAVAVERPATETDAPPLTADELQGDTYTPSYGQRSLWFLHHLAPDEAAYNIAGAARIAGAFDPPRFQRALDGLVDRHPVLRTTFARADGALTAQVHERLPCAFEIVESEGKDEAHLRANMEDAAHAPFDLETGPLLRAHVFRLAPDDQRLVLAVHHIAADFWTVALLLRELGALYAAQDDSSPDLAALPFTYQDFARRQEAWLQAPAGERAWDYWRDQLHDLPLLALPTDRPHPPAETFAGASLQLAIAPPVAARLLALGAEHGATPYMTLLAAFQALLGRYSGQRDLTVGSPMTVRDDEGLANLVGYFVNPVVLRADLGRRPKSLRGRNARREKVKRLSAAQALTFATLLDRTRSTVRAALAHRGYPFPLLVERLQLESDGGRSPLFQVAFSWQQDRLPEEAGLAAFALGAAETRLALGPLTLEPIPLQTRSVPFELTLSLAPTADGLAGSLSYKTDLFDPTTIQRFGCHLVQLLTAVAAAPARPLAALDLFSPAEHQQLMVEWNDTAWTREAREGGGPALAHHHFAHHARRAPDRAAVVTDTTTLTYGALARRAERLAGQLRGEGVGPETVVAVLLERSPELVTAVLAIHQAGGAYLPLDPAQPGQRIAYMVEDASAPLVLTAQRFQHLLPTVLEAAVIFLDGSSDASATRTASGRSKETLWAEDHLAYVIYTSGSTGRPKGTELCHAGLSNLVVWHRQTYGLTPAARATLVAAPGFDAAVWELWPYLASGASLAIPAAETLLAPRHLLHWLAKARITHCFLPTPLAEAALAVDEAPPIALQLLLTGGDRLQAAPTAVLPFALVNHYGPTESTVVTTFARVRQSVHPAPPSIGRPVANTRVYVLDQAGQPTLPGCPGELAIGGLGLARGYRRRPVLTAERFRPDSFAETPGARLYRTGDRVRHGHDGQIDFLDRMDQQVKIRGFRVELGEIEAVLNAEPDVHQGVVLSRQDPRGATQLVAYVVAEGTTELPPLRQRLATRLPPYMVPSAVVRLEALPLTPNGKVDRRALPAPQWGGSEEAGALPRTPVEEMLAGIWTEVLGVEHVGADDSFFDLGGHSLLATQAISRVREVFAVELPLRHLFATPTVAALAAAIEAAQDAEESTVIPPLEPAPRDGALPLSFAQDRLWFLDQLEPGSTLYNIPGAVRLRGPLDPDALRRTFAAIIARHEALRTTFATTAEEPCQRIAPQLSLPLLMVDLGGLEPPRRASELRHRARREAATPFDLGSGPLLRLTLVRLADEGHVLLLTLHHIVADGWSVGIIIRELTAFYPRAVAGTEGDALAATLPPLPLQYADFAIWQRRWLRDDTLAREIAFWRQQLTGVPSLEIPTDRPRPVVRATRGAALERLLPAPLGDQLEALARRQGVTLFMLLLTAFQALLHRYTGARDFTVGTPIANRNRRQTEELIGFFVNTLVLRADLGGEPRVTELLQRCRATTLAAYAHQDVPFEKLVEALAPQRDLARTPLFQVAFALQNAPLAPLALPGLGLEPVPIPLEQVKFELGLTAEPGKVPGQPGDGETTLILRFTYAVDLFDHTRIARMSGHFLSLLRSLVADPEQRLSVLALLGEAERHQLLVAWNNSEPDYEVGGERFLHQLVATTARRQPERVAVVSAERSLTYGALAQRSAELARHLQQLGVGPERLVGIMIERSFEMVIALLATLEAGGAYLPLDPDAPPQRQALILDDAAAGMALPVVLTQPHLEGRLPHTDAAIVTLDSDGQSHSHSDGALRPAPHSPAVCLDAHHSAYQLYTSGSTGLPKGVIISHHSVVSRLAWVRAREASSAGAVLHKASLGFDLSVTEIFSPLVAGGRIVLAPPGRQHESDQLLAEIARQRVTQASFLPSQLAAIVAMGGLTNLRALRALMTGGEAVPQELPGRVHAQLAVDLHNRYGPTEATISVVSWRCRGASTVAPPIGRPFARSEIYLLDARFLPVPAGIPGEIAIGGRCLARGYLARRALTAARFVPHPFAVTPGQRLYRSGDLATYRHDGLILFLGRIDQQVKVRGFRIELGEVQKALAAHPSVRDAVVVDRHDPTTASNRLAAYLVLVGEEPAPGTWRAFLLERLPDYMVPAAFVTLEALPLTARGKVDRQALPEPEWAGSRAGTYVAPTSPTERRLAAIWQEVLEVERVGATDGFFDLGGHSLLATRAMARVRKAFHIDLPLRALFEHPTVEALAQLIDAQEAGGEEVPLGPAAEGGTPMLSFAQERMWFLHQLEGEAGTYHMPAAMRLRGRLDPAALAAAFGHIVRRHATLRTTFREAHGRPYPKVGEHPAVALPIIDLTALDAAAQRPTIDLLATEEARRPFNLAAGPLLRLTLLRTAPDEHVLLVTMHHIISDGWSIGIFIREMAQLYTAAVSGRPAALPPLPIQYSDFARRQRRLLSGSYLQEQVDYWRHTLTGIPTLELPTDRPRPAVPSPRGAELPVTLSPARYAAVTHLAKGTETTPFMVLLAAFAALLGRLAGQQDVAIGSPIANRTQVEVEDLIGFFVNTLVLRTDLRADPSAEALIRRVRDTALGAYAHQDLPFEKLVEEVAPRRDLSTTPLFQVLFTLQNVPRERLTLPALTLERIPQPTHTAIFDLHLSLGERVGGLAGTLTYRPDLFDPTTLLRLRQRFMNLLEGLVDRPQAPLSTLPLMGADERFQLLHAWNPAAPGWPRDATLVDLFTAQAARTPDAIAIAAAGQRLSYRCLARRATLLAHHLRRLGVASEVRVGIALPRTPEMVVALLAVLEAGGAYVALDPAYPRQRLAFMRADAGVRLVLTTRALRPDLAEEDDSLSVLCLDEAPFAVPTVLPRPCPARAENLAYLIYTSGSTGRPKGVAIAHHSAVTLVRWAHQRFATPELNAVLAATSINFDLSIFELFVPLAAGGTVILAADALALLEMPERQTVTLINTVPSAIAELVRAAPLPASVHTVNLAGEPLRRSLADAVYQAGARRVCNLYGPSEDTTYSTCAEVPRGGAAPPSIGRPITATRAFLLDRHLQPVPGGAVGELYLGGDGLARGYLARPALTAARFLPDPFAGTEPGGERLYRSGDLARYLHDGALAFLGRADHQVKVRGFRIELGEIEAALLTHPEVEEAVVMVRQAGEGQDRRLVAYVASTAGPDGETLRTHLAARLPAHMVPAACVVLDVLPHLPNAKVDRKALPAVDWTGSAATFQPPRTPLEEMIAGLFATVLGTERVGADGDFFALGGHSLLATQLISRLRQALGMEIPLNQVFATPTVAGLAQALEATGRAEGERTLTEITAEPHSGMAPLSFAQERLWLIDRLAPGRATYNLPAAVRLRGTLQIPALGAALAEIGRRHETLRTTFITDDDGRPVQHIAPSITPTLPIADLDALADRAAQAAGQAATRATVLAPFDLTTGPLLRLLLLKLADDEHVLLITLHHIIADGWSIGVLIRELAACYRAHLHGVSAALPALPIQYADFAVWQRRWLRGSVLTQQLDYWCQTLQEVPVLELPTDRPRPTTASDRGATLAITWPPTLRAALERMARQEGTTLYMVLLAAFATLLSQTSGQRDIAIGCPIANRNRRELEPLIGFFINTLVMRVDLTGDPTFRTILRRVRRLTLEAYEHQDLPFERLVEALQPARDQGTTPLFQVLLVLQNAPRAPLALPGLESERLRLEGETAKFDLTLSLNVEDGQLAGILEYRRALFDATTMARLGERLQRLLTTLTADPGRALSHLPTLGPAEAHQVRHDWNDTARPYPRHATLHRLFATQAAATPDAVALCTADTHLSYGALDRRAERLAHELQCRGVGAEIVVGLCLERGPAMIVATIAILKAGGAYLPLDPSYPTDRLAFMLTDTVAPLILASHRTAAALPKANDWQVIDIDEAIRDGASAPMSLRPRQAADSPLGLAYLMYTSGSTGRPKGVAAHHRAVIRLVLGNDFADLGPGEIFLQLAPVSFDAATLEIWAPLLNGGRLVLAPPEQTSLAALGSLLARHRVTTLWLTAGLFQQMAEHHAADLDGLRQLLAGGDVLSPAHVSRVLAHHPGLVLSNGYGPTENTTFTTCHPMATPTAVSSPVSIGRPIANSCVYLFDRHGRPAPIGVPGRLFAGGEGLARGYHRRPALTAARFVPDPTGSAPGNRLYDTADYARFQPDGTLTFLGRADHQVKVRGYRVELGEIEAALVDHPEVREAVVLLREDRPGDKRLVAYLVVAEPMPTTTALRTFLRRRLPEPMLPAAFVILNALPLDANGKVQRSVLPAPLTTASEGEERAAGSPIEEMLAGIFAEVLGHEGVGIDQSFFELGGHSLLATQVVSRIAAVFAVDIPLRQLFETPTVAGLAPAVEAAMAAGEGGLAPPVEPIPRGDDLPLSFAQERLWFLEQLQPGGSLYNVPAALRLDGRLAHAALARSLSEIQRRHEALRTTFRTSDGQPRQIIAAPSTLPLPRIDLGTLPAPRRRAVLDRLIADEAQRPFDLERGPLLRVTLVRLDSRLHTLLLTLHHIVSDGWSTGIFIRELAALYAAFATGKPSPLAPLAVHYGDFACWQRHWLTGETLDAQLDYWRRQLAGVKPLEIPADRPRPAVRTTRGAAFGITLTEQENAALRAIGRRQSATLFMVLASAFQALLHRYTGQRDLTLGSPIANRNRREIEPLIGFFVNTIVLRAELADDPTVEALLARTRNTALDAFRHQDLPFERLVEALEPKRDLARTPLFQVAFALQNTPGGSLALPGLDLTPLDRPPREVKFELGLTAFETAVGALRLVLAYNRDIFDRVRIQRLAGHLRVLLAALAAQPGRRLSQLPLLRAAEQHQLRLAWNDEPAYPDTPAARLHDLVASQATRAPDAIALVCEGSALTYECLEQRALALADRLRDLGVGPERLVGVCAERSPALVIGLLAILEAGAAYLPLDPSLPAQRLAYLLTDANRTMAVPVVLTESHLQASLPTFDGTVLTLDALCRHQPRPSAAMPAPASRRACPQSPAYVIYTSGSTGKPKGVVISHRAAVNRLRWVQAHEADTAAAILQKTSISFDLSVVEIFSPLVCGGRLILTRPGGQYEIDYLLRRVAEERITQVSFLPSQLALIVAQGGLAALPSLRAVMTGGEAVPAELPGQVLDQAAVEVHNRYGPTETTVSVISWRCARGEAILPIGRPFAHTAVHLLDARLWPVAAGIPGEITIAGSGLARGYLGRPATTARRFVPDPLATTPGSRLYRSGDLAVQRHDGALLFLGRLDQQVKVRGFRIELGEIETVLRRHPTVAEAAVIDLADGATRRLAAYLVAAPVAIAEGAALDPAVLRTFLATRLPDYMVPAAFVSLDALPLQASGKVDRKALPAPDWTAARGTAYTAPRGEHEQAVAALWVELLGLQEKQRVGAHDSFFELGGHSLLATRLVSRLRQRFGVEIPLRTIFEQPTVAEIAELVAHDMTAMPAPRNAPPLMPLPRHGDLPLSFSQERLWILEQLEPGNAAYSIPASVRLRGRLHTAALRRAFTRLVARHESLRTTFHRRGGHPVQVIAPTAAVSMPFIDLRLLDDPQQRDGVVAALLRREANAPFDLARGPLWRVSLLRLDDDSHLLLLNLHHIIADGWSFTVLIREVAMSYDAYLAGRPDPFPSLAVQYADFAAWQRDWLSGEERARQLDYWRVALQDLPPGLELPTDRPRPAVRTFQSGRQGLVLGAALTARLEELSRDEGATLFMTLLAALQLLLGRLAGQQDFAIGTPIAGRRHTETEQLIGMFLNNLVLRADLAGSPTFRSLLGRARNTTLAAYDHQELPFEALLDGLQIERDLTRTPLFQVFFNMLNLPLEPMALTGLTLEPVASPELPSKFDLTLYVAHQEAGIRFNLVFNAFLFSEARIAFLLEQLQAVLEQVAADPDVAIDRVDLLTPRMRALLPDPKTPLDATWHGAIHQRVAARAARQPDQVAVMDQDGAWTYAQLMAQSRRLAHRLQREGVAKGDVVTVYAHRSAALVYAVIGVLEAGAAFVLLDPLYPAQRLIDILRRARPRAWVQLEAAGPLPEALDAFLTQEACPRLVLPPWHSHEDGGPLADEPTHDPEVTIGPDDLALLAFTSGSTGEPKGIEGRHGPLTHFIPWQADYFGLHEGDRYSLLSGLAHDPLQRDIFTPLALGATIVVPDPDQVFIPGYLARWMRDQKIAIAHLTPAMGQLLAQVDDDELRIPSLRYVLLVGDILTRRDVARLQKLAPNVRCINLYGSTETQRAVAFYACPDAGDEDQKQVLPLGRGMPDVQLLLRNEAGLLAGVGEVGEIWVRSPHLARGYRDDAELSRQRFQPNPFSGEMSDRTYRTGDLGRYLPDGNVVFAGRADRQVKVRGFRIELGEIEAQLGTLPGVAEAAVLPRGEEGRKHLVAYLQPAPGAELETAMLRDALAKRLPGYMVPASFITLERLPLNPNGKVDRNALAQRKDEAPRPEAAYRAPGSELENTISTILQEVLASERVGVDDNFFELGANSLLLVQIHARLQEALGRTLQPVELFNHPTVATLAAFLGQDEAASAKPDHDRAAKLAKGRERLKRRRRQRRS